MEANPFTLRAFPPVSFTMSRGRGNLTLSPPLPAFSSPADTSPIFCVAKHPVILRDTAGRREKYFPRIYSPIRLTEDLYIALRHPVNAMRHGREGGLNTIPIMPHHSLAVLRRVLAMPRGTRQGRGVEMFPLSRERWKVGYFMSCAV